MLTYLKAVNNRKPLSPEEEKELWAAFKNNSDTGARKRLILAYQPLVIKIASGYQENNQLRMDLIQEGTLGLIEALERYEPERGIKFATYARHRIRGRILNYIKEVVSSSRDTFSLDQEGISALILNGSSHSLESRVETKEINEKLLKAINKLPGKERYTLTSLFLNGDDPETVAKELGCSRAHVYRLKKNGISRVRGYLSRFWKEIKNG